MISIGDLKARFNLWMWKLRLRALKHVTRETASGAQVYVLNTGAVINPEAEAMLQALHSRSIGGILSHLKVLAKAGAEKFLSMYYVGYGHKSIGDCGTTTIFIEGVSMLAAKAIQDWPLFSGQESSTRYIDFAKQKFINPLGTAWGAAILERLRRFYLGSMDRVIAHLKGRFPRQEGEKENIYEKAIKARAFDILRGFLPAGASTNLAWHTNLRQAADHLMHLRHHPLEEVRDLAEAIESALKEAHPGSFNHNRYPLTEQYNRDWMSNGYYYFPMDCPDFKMNSDNFQHRSLKEFEMLLSTRPPRTELPKAVAACGTIRFDFLLDYGSFRDIQRHRAVHQRMPLLTSDYMFEGWYLDELPEDVRSEALALLEEQEDEITLRVHDPHVRQYYTAMGYRVPCVVIGDLPALVYLGELRYTQFVHPTLRRRAKQIVEGLLSFLSPILKLHLAEDPDRFDVRRGEHDIVAKI